MNKQHTFPCPICGRPIESVTRLDGTASMFHPKPLCGANNGDMLTAYVAAIKPEMKYPPLKA